jgi:MiaB-like tRNA modifying enzyme
MKIYTEVHGCSANQADYEMALGLLKQHGCSFCKTQSESDINIIFTCCVKVPTTSRMIYRIGELTKLGKPLIVAGCMPKTMRTTIERVNPSVSMIGPDAIERITVAVDYATKGKKFVWLQDMRNPKVLLPRLRRNPVIGIIEISTGCLGNCSYCGVKFAKGKLFSYPPEMILKEAKTAVEEGCKELWLTSQDNSCYGKDIGNSLPKLLNSICEIEKKFFVRIGMMNPLHAKEITQKLLEAYENEKIFKFLHLPVQSFSEGVLKNMKRGYSPKAALEIIENFYKKFKWTSFSTDIIVGFPGESDSDFEKTIGFIKKVKPDIVNISKFGLLPGTEAVNLKQLPRDTVNKRSKELVEISKTISLEKNQKWLGWSGECLIDELGRKGTWIGRNFAYKPIVVQSSKNIFEKFVDVKIIDAKDTYLLGKMI